MAASHPVVRNYARKRGFAPRAFGPRPSDKGNNRSPDLYLRKSRSLLLLSVGGPNKSLTNLKSIPGFELVLTKLRLNRPGGLKQALEALGSEFKINLTKTGRGQNTIQLRHPRTRVRKKAAFPN